MKVVILCGGKGTRLKEKTEEIPKPLVDVGDKPILWHIMNIYAHYGFNDFILLGGYKVDKLHEYFDENKHGWNVDIVDTGLEASKSERIQQVKEKVGDEFFLVYGDDVSDINIKSILEFHKRNGKVLTLAAIPLRSNYGIMNINEEHEVTEFQEKPLLPGYWFNGGFMVASSKLFEYLNLGELENEVFEHLANLSEITAYKHDGFWLSMNTFKENIDLNNLWENNKAPWKVWKD